MNKLDEVLPKHTYFFQFWNLLKTWMTHVGGDLVISDSINNWIRDLPM